MPRRFPPPWSVEQIPGGYKVIAKVLTMDEARRIASNIANLPELLTRLELASAGRVKASKQGLLHREMRESLLSAE